jgi:hypothetical protein
LNLIDNSAFELYSANDTRPDYLHRWPGAFSENLNNVNWSGDLPPSVEWTMYLNRPFGTGTADPVRVGQQLHRFDSRAYIGKHLTLSFYAMAAPGWMSKYGVLKAAIVTANSTPQPGETLVDWTWNTSQGGIGPDVVGVADAYPVSVEFQRFTVTTYEPIGENVDTIGVVFEYTPITVDIDGNAVTADTDLCYITAVQLEEGVRATEYIRKPIADEKDACARWYRHIRFPTPGDYEQPMDSYGYSTSTISALITVPHPGMIAIPRMLAPDSAGLFAVINDASPPGRRTIDTMTRQYGTKDSTTVAVTITDVAPKMNNRQFQQLHSASGWDGNEGLIFTCEEGYEADYPE